MLFYGIHLLCTIGVHSTLHPHHCSNKSYFTSTFCSFLINVILSKTTGSGENGSVLYGFFCAV